MPVRKKQALSGGQRIEKTEIIVLSLPLVCLGLFLLAVLPNNRPVSGIAASASLATPVPTTLTITSPAIPTAVTLTTSSIPVPGATGIAAATSTSETTLAATITPGRVNISGSAPTAGATARATATAASQTVRPGEPEGTGVRLTKTEGGIKFDLLVSPGHIGNNTYTLLLSENGNQAVTDISLLRLSVTSLEMDMGVATLDLQPAGVDQPGLYTGNDKKLQMLSMVGKFNLAVLVRRPGQDDVTTSFQLDVRGS